MRLVAILVQLQGANGQGGPVEIGMIEYMVVAILIFIGTLTILRWLWSMVCRRMLGLQPEEEPEGGEDEDQPRESEEGLRRRRRQVSDPWRTPDRSTNPSPRPVQGTPQRERGEETRGSPTLSEEFVQEVRRQMLGFQRPEEPGGEPGTFQEDFVSGATVFEGYTHPDDWTPETHGDILPGKGEPPPSYFGGRPKGGRKAEGKKAGGEKGRSVWASHGGGDGASSSSGMQQVPPFPDLRRSEGGRSHQESERSEESRDQGGSSAGGQGGPSAGGPGGEQAGGRLPVYITPYGTKFHLSVRCQSLRKSRNLVASNWCADCAAGTPNDVPRWMFCHGPGGDAHEHHLCIGAQGGTLYEKCGLCRFGR